MSNPSRATLVSAAMAFAVVSTATLAGPTLTDLKTAVQKPNSAQPAAAPSGGAKMRLKGIRAVPETWNGACPHEIRIEATWESLSAGEVQYTWLRSDGGTQSKPSTLSFTGPNQVKTVVDTWTLGGPGFNKTLWVKMKELSPYPGLTPEAKFTVNCH